MAAAIPATVTATVTLTATPPLTTVFVTAPCSSPPIQIITATYTAPKLPDDYPLHLLPPFSLSSLTTTLSASTSASSSKPSRLAYATSVRPFPNGAAPETPDPLGIHDVPWYYGPGISTLLNLIAVAAILQLHIGPPSQRVQQTETVPVAPKSDLLPRLQNRISMTTAALPVLHVLVVATLAAMNRAAWDLLLSYVRMARLRRNQDPTWTIQAGQMGPPFTMLTWGLMASVWRVILCIVRIQPDSPSRWRGSGTNPDAAQKLRQKAKTADHTRLLALEGVGATLPASALGILVFNKWVWLGGTTVESKMDAVIPSDFMPAVYWDSMGASFHAILILGIACTGLTYVILGAFSLFCLNLEFFEHCHRWVEKRVCRNPFRRLWRTYLAVLVVGLVLCVIQLLCIFVGVGDGSEWAQDFGDRYGGTMIAVSMALASPSVLIIFPMFLLCFLFYFLPLFLWYLLRGWVFGVMDVRRSSFFIPYTERSVWERGQLMMVILGLGLVVLSWYQVCQISPRKPPANRRMRTRQS